MFLLLSIAVIIFSLIILPENITYRYLDFFTSDNVQELSSVGSRIQLQTAAINIIMANPLFGLGLAGFEHIYGLGNYPHNIFLELLAELGIFGVVFYVLFIIDIFLKGINSSRTEKKNPLVLSCLIPLIFVSIASQVSGNLNDLRLFFFFSGIIILMNEIDMTDEEKYELN
jgi:O-antigen ligase